MRGDRGKDVDVLDLVQTEREAVDADPSARASFPASFGVPGAVG